MEGTLDEKQKYILFSSAGEGVFTHGGNDRSFYSGDHGEHHRYIILESCPKIQA
jgi:hypothetical protein